MRTLAVTALSALVASVSLACESSDEEPAPPVVEKPAGDCAPGEWKRDDGTCVAAGLPPDMPCAPGELPRDDGACIPAGVAPDGCGEGFTHDGDRGCDPVLPAAACPEGLLAVPGETRCHEIAPCAPGWGDIPIEPDTEHVDAGYAGGTSDGSALAPWTSIQAAVDAAAPGAIVAIAAGSYSEDVQVVGKAVRLWGVCPADVEIVGTGAEAAAVQVLTGASKTEVRDLAIRGVANGFFASNALDVKLERLWVHDNFGWGVIARNDLGATRIALHGSLLEDNHEVALFVGAAEATVEASVLRETQSITGGLYGRGISVRAHPTTGAASTLVLRSSVVEQNHEVGLYVEASEVTVETSVVRATQPDGTGFGGRGIEVQGHHATGAPSTFVLETSVVESNHDVGVIVSGSKATLDSVVVRDTGPDAQGQSGRGLSVQQDPTTGAPATVEVSASLIDRNLDTGMFVAGANVTVDASAIRNTASNAQGIGGRGLNVQSSTMAAASTLLFRSSLVEQSREIGVFGEGSSLTLEASAVRGTRASPMGGGGRGVEIHPNIVTGAHATLVLDSSLVEQNQEVGVFLLSADGTIETSVVRDTLPNAQGLRGHGIHARADATAGTPSTLHVDRSAIERSTETGVVVMGSVATIDASVVSDVAPSPGWGGGDGVMVVSFGGDASLGIHATHIHKSARAGVTSWGASASIQGSALTCQAFDLDQEPFDDKPGAFEDLGANGCGCPEPSTSCAAASASLEPPTPLDPAPSE